MRIEELIYYRTHLNEKLNNFYYDFSHISLLCNAFPIQTSKNTEIPNMQFLMLHFTFLQRFTRKKINSRNRTNAHNRLIAE